jgi:protein-tyrosine phosphatase
MIRKLLVVCTGNICRSPIAEFVLRAKLGGDGREVASAGTYAMIGHGADPHSIEVAQRHGLDLKPHRAQQATASLVRDAELILTLDQSHSQWLLQRYPQLRGRVHKLLKWRGDADIEDPYQLPLAAFEQAYREIEQGADDWIAKL